MGIIRLCVFDSFCMLVNSCFVLTAPNIVRCDVMYGMGEFNAVCVSVQTVVCCGRF